MANTKIFKLNEIDLDNITYGDVIKHHDISTININYSYENKYVPLLIETEYFYSIDGIKEISLKHFTHEIVLLLQSKSDTKTQHLIDFFNNLDKKIIQDGMNEKYDWDTYEELTYKVLVRKVNNDNDIYNNGVVKIKLYENGRFKTILYNKNKKSINKEDCKQYFNKYCYIKVIMELVSLKKNDKGIFEIFVRTHQLLIDTDEPPINLLNKYEFKDTSPVLVQRNSSTSVQLTDDIIQLNTTSDNSSLISLDSESSTDLDNNTKSSEIINLNL